MYSKCWLRCKLPCTTSTSRRNWWTLFRCDDELVHVKYVTSHLEYIIIIMRTIVHARAYSRMAVASEGGAEGKGEKWRVTTVEDHVPSE